MKKGSYGERMAHLITEEILKKADYCIELQNRWLKTIIFYLKFIVILKMKGQKNWLKYLDLL